MFKEIVKKYTYTITGALKTTVDYYPTFLGKMLKNEFKMSKHYYLLYYPCYLLTL